MANFRQAPRNTNKKPDCGGNFMKIGVELFQKINEKVDVKHSVARSLMYLMVGTADGFKLSQKFVLEKINCSEKAYYQAREYLEKLGLITYDKEKNELIINYVNIMGSIQVSASEEKDRIEVSPSKLMSSIQESAKGLLEDIPLGRIQECYNIEETNKKHINMEPQAVLSVSEAKASGRFQEDDIRGVITKRDLERIGEENIIILENGVIQSKLTGMKFRLRS